MQNKNTHTNSFLYILHIFLLLVSFRYTCGTKSSIITWSKDKGRDIRGNTDRRNCGYLLDIIVREFIICIV